jgi:hypothetical protein
LGGCKAQGIPKGGFGRVLARKAKKGEKFSSAARIGLRPVLAADKNFSPFFAFLAKTRPKPPFGIPRALQPPKTNVIIFLVILFRIDSHSTYHI